MAFYKDFEKKTRQEKRDIASSRGGYDDEGAKSCGKAKAIREEREAFLANKD